MRRTRHLVAFVLAVAMSIGIAGSTVAQLPPTTLPDATPPGFTPPVTTPPATAPSVTPPSVTVPPGSTITDTAPMMPAGPSTWLSQDGSIVELTVDATAGTLTGTFAPGFPCGPPSTGSPAPRPIVGTVNGNAVAWTLSLPACPSVGTWVGHYRTVEAAEQLTMLWTLALTEFPPGVGSTFTGSALFVRQTAR
jgi:hypothetical protein